MRPIARIALFFPLLSVTFGFPSVSHFNALVIAAGPATTQSSPSSAPGRILIHLPGIAGEMRIDHDLVDGLVAGGVAPEAKIVDWTGRDRGVPALTNVARHHEQAKKLAEQLTSIAKASPGSPIILIAHSAGTGIAVEALENLPAGVNIDTLVLLASALSPGYDLTPALRHVDGRGMSFYSQYDEAVLGKGTRVFGTYDRVFSDAAGYVGFTPPKTADPAIYAKLTQYPYDPAWMKYGNGGEHIGTTNRPWAKAILAPLLNEPIRTAPASPK